MEKSNKCDAPEVFRRLGVFFILIIMFLIVFLYISFIMTNYYNSIQDSEVHKSFKDIFGVIDYIVLIGLIFFITSLGEKFLEFLDCRFFDSNKNIDSYKKGLFIEGYIVWIKLILITIIVGGIVSSIIGGFIGFVIGIIVGVITAFLSEINK